MRDAEEHGGASLSAWRRALRLWAAERQVQYETASGEETTVRRLLVEVERGGDSEWVALSLRDARLQVCAERGEPAPPVTALLLALLAGEDAAVADSRGGEPGEPPLRFSLMPPGEEAPTRLSSGAWRLVADAIEELALAVGRAGVLEALRAPAFREALSHLGEHLPAEATGVRRWVGRLRNALAAQDVLDVAGLLASALRFVSSVREDGSMGGAERARAIWTGRLRHQGTASGVERVLLELGRERLDGLERDELEQRYLLEPEAGELFVESVVRSGGSVGPVPRTLRVGLAESGHAPSGPRLRPLQYAVSLGMPEGDTWEPIEAAAFTEFGAVLDLYRGMERLVGRLAEPVVLLAPSELEGVEVGRVRALDAHGRPLPLARTGRGEVSALLEAIGAGAQVRWLLGRLLVRGGGLSLRLVSAGLHDGGETRLLRIR